MKYTEIFYSIQGEARNTGKLCTWLRTFSCTLECKGFGQKHPELHDTWVDPTEGVDFKAYTDLMQVPTPKYGCDSAYSWSKNYRHLAKNNTPQELAEMIRLTTPNGSFEGKIGHVFTGGEPMMWSDDIADIIEIWLVNGDCPAWIGIETNGTRPISDKLRKVMADHPWLDIYFSISPKLLHVAGEDPRKAISIDVITDMLKYDGYLKFVLNLNDYAWTQAQQIVDEIELKLLTPEVWVMPVGGTIEGQESEDVAKIADKAIFEYAWNVSPRVHVLLWRDQQIGR